jgi:oligopeptide/dipeptide ABC transporter ATP-binding protein
MALMLDLQRDTGVSYLYITHDLAVARHMAACIAVMYRGAIVEEGPMETVLEAAAHPYTRLLISAVPEHRPGGKRKRARVVADATEEEAGFTGCRYARRCPAARDICRTTAPPAVALAPGHRASCHFAAEIRARGLPV